MARVSNVPFEQVPEDLRVIMQEYDAELVLQDVRAALVDTFSLEERKLGQPLYLSEIYRVVEQTTGVENSRCVINDDATLRVLRSTEARVIHLDQDAPALTLEATEFVL